MADELEAKLIEIVQSVLRDQTGDPGLCIGPGDSMDTVADWDSLAFMGVFAAVNAAFALDPDFDDAIHYVSIPALKQYLGGELP
jgi:acyl carrier protein